MARGWEGSKADLADDKKQAAKRKEPLKKWEGSAADAKRDAKKTVRATIKAAMRGKK